MTELLAELGPGEELGPYRVESLVAAGGSSLVYRATHVPSGEFVAIKIGRGSGDELYRRLRREAELLSAVDHPNIVAFRDAGLHLDRPFIVIDWIEGRPLADVVDEFGPIGVDGALDIVAVVADALDHLHGLGIVHRDLSLANVLLDGDGSPMLIDLGVGRAERSSTVTLDGSIAGTPRYVAPEVIRGDGVDARADQYSLAVILHELIAGRSPFPETDNAATALYQQLDVLPEPLTEVDPAVPVATEAAVLRALEKAPADRFDSVLDLVDSAAGRRAVGTGRRGGLGTGRPVGRLVALVAVVAAIGIAVAAFSLRGDDEGPVATGEGTEEPTPGASTTSSVPTTGSELPGPGTADDTTVTTTASSTPTTAESTTTVVAAPGFAQPPAGTAAGYECNLLTVTGFDDGVAAEDFYAPAETETVQPGIGVDGTPGLRVGGPGQFGQYAELVSVSPGAVYGFAGWFSVQGEIGDVRIGVTFLDAAFEEIPSAGAERPLGGTVRHVLTTEPAPPTARWALPWVFKDASEGFVDADELVFSVEGGCAADYLTDGPVGT